MIQRAYFETIAKLIDEPRKFIQIIEGPRQRSSVPSVLCWLAKKAFPLRLS